MLATGTRTRSPIKRILAIALPVVGRQIRTIRVRGAILVALLGLVVSGFSQTTVSTGGIQGTVTDPSGALVTGAIVSITNTATGQTASVNTNSAGAYTFAFLKPADYVVRIEARSFKTTRLPITVKVDQTANGNATLVVGDSSETVDVSASDLQVNTIQATVQGVLTPTQIANLPVNGRNFLDLAQLEPGVQIQDGQNFDPTKAGYSSISFGGRFGRTARIEVDGADVSDETVGTTTTDIPSSAIQGRLEGLVDKRRRLTLRNLPRQSWNKFRVPAFPLALLIEKFGDQFLTKNCSPYVTHFDLGGGRRQELQENGQQVFGNAGKWQTP